MSFVVTLIISSLLCQTGDCAAEENRPIARLGDGTRITYEDVSLWSALQGFPEQAVDPVWKKQAATEIALGRIARELCPAEYRPKVQSINSATPFTLSHFAATRLRQVWIEEATPSEKMVRKAYAEWISSNTPETKVLFDHLFLDTHHLTTSEGKLRVARTAAALRRRMENGEPFADLARNYSDAKSARLGGRSGPLPLGTFSPRFEKVLLTLQDGEISDVIRGKYGFHLLRREKLIRGTIPAFTEMRKKLSLSLRRQIAYQKETALIKQSPLPPLELSDKMLLNIRQSLPWDPGTLPLIESATRILQTFLKREHILGAEAARRQINQNTQVRKKVELWQEREYLKLYFKEHSLTEEVSEKEVAEYMSEHPSDLYALEQIHLAIIKVFDSVSTGASPAQKYLAREWTAQKLQKALDRLKKGECFASVARDISDDPSAVNGGDIGLSPRNRRGHVIAEACAGLKDGEISGIVWGRNYGMIVRKVETIPSKPLPPKEAMQKAKRIITAKRKRKTIRALRHQLLESHGFTWVESSAGS